MLILEVIAETHWNYSALNWEKISVPYTSMLNNVVPMAAAPGLLYADHASNQIT